MSEKAPFMVFSGTNSRYLAEKICASLDCPLGNMNITHFADGEFAVSYEESIRGAHVFLVQSTFPNSDNLMELLLMIDAAKRASAKSVVAVVWIYFRLGKSFRRCTEDFPKFPMLSMPFATDMPHLRRSRVFRNQFLSGNAWLSLPLFRALLSPAAGRRSFFFLHRLIVFTYAENAGQIFLCPAFSIFMFMIQAAAIPHPA